LSIRANSNQKEGAWAFLEYLLSAEYQDSAGYLSVRIDSFEKALSAKQIHRFQDNTITEENKELLLYLIENAYWSTTYFTAEHNTIRNIIYEEAAPFWTGDNTAEQVAEIIQNRVSLVLKE
jgi:multiple sugar transport system substrate-binding protein